MKVPPTCASLPAGSFRLAAFSLIELLSVIAILAVMSGVALPAFRALTEAENLSGAGYRLDQFFSGARQNSLSKGVYTAVVVLTSPTEVGAYRTMAAFELAPRADGSLPDSTDWRQVSKWEQLPEGIIVDNDPARSGFLTGPSVCVLPAPSEVVYRGVSRQLGVDYVWQVFSPSGRLGSAPSPCTLSLVVGHYVGNTPAYASKPRENFFNFTFIDATGETKITRP